jgi:uncharacterized protein (TIGR03118 family)
MSPLTLVVVANTIAGTASAQHYVKMNLTSDLASLAPKVDPDLINGWGVARSSTSPWWVSDNGTEKSTLYDAQGTKQALVVNVPGAPTGTVFNASRDFEVTPGNPAVFLFVTESGDVLGWNPTVDRGNARVVASHRGAIYKGVAIATWGGKRYLYAADFHNGQIDVYDSSFQMVAPPHHDEDRGIRMIGSMRGMAPFNVQNIGNTLFVAFAKQDQDKEDEVAGAGLGLVAAFTPRGRLLRIFEHVDGLNAPWALTLAPGDFGTFTHNLLVGQFGSGEILAFNINTGEFAGKLLETSGSPLKIDGLWGLGFGNGATAGPATTLFFAAGPDDEHHGLFGSIVPVATEQPGNSN